MKVAVESLELNQAETYRFYSGFRWVSVFEGDGEPCIEWVATKNRNGYGTLTVGGITRLAHRVSFMFRHGSIPKCLDHLCRNRACINPSHLEGVSQAENCKRGMGGKSQLLKTMCPSGHEYSGRNLIVYDGRRYCRECMRKHTKSWKLKTGVHKS